MQNSNRSNSLFRSDYRQAKAKLQKYTNLKPILARYPVTKLAYKQNNVLIVDFDLGIYSDVQLEDFLRAYLNRRFKLLALPSPFIITKIDLGSFAKLYKLQQKFLKSFASYIREIQLSNSSDSKSKALAISTYPQAVKQIKDILNMNLFVLSANHVKLGLLPQGLFYLNTRQLFYRFRKLLSQYLDRSYTNKTTIELVKTLLAITDTSVRQISERDKQKLVILNIPIVVRDILTDVNGNSLNIDELLKSTILGSLVYLLKKYRQIGVYSFDAVTITLELPNGGYRIVPICIGNECASYQRVIQFVKSHLEFALHETELIEKLDELKSRVKRVLKQTLGVRKLEKLGGEQALESIANLVATTATQNPDIALKVSKITASTIKDILKETLEVEDVPVESNKLEELVKKALEIAPVRWEIPYHDELQETFSYVKEVGSAHTARPLMLEEGFKLQLKLYNYTLASQFNTPIIRIERRPKQLNDIEETLVDEYVIYFKDRDLNRIIKKSIYLPRLIEGKYFLHNGRKRTILYQLFQKPIFAAKPFEVIIRSVFTTLTIRSKIKSKHRALVTYIMGREVPLALVLAVYYCDLEKIFNKFGGKIVITDTPIDKTYSLRLESGKYLSLDVQNSSNIAKQLFWSLVITVGKRNRLPDDALTSCDYWHAYITTNYGGRYLRTIKQGLDLLVDPTTKLVLQAEKLPTQTLDILKYASELAASGKIDTLTDLTNRRIRTSEAIAQVLFKHLYMAMRKYQLEKEFKKTKSESLDIKIEPDYVIKQLTTRALQSQYQLVQDLNPLIESEYFTRITYAGLQGISDKQATPQMRTVHPSMYGSIDPIDTPDSANVGVVRHLALDADISSMVGKFVIKPFGEPGVNIFSISGSQIPMALHNDGNRVQFANAQFKSDIRIVGSQPPLVMSGYEALVGYFSSSDFAIKSPCNGKIEEIIDDRFIVINCKKEGKKLIELKIKGLAEAVGIKQKPIINEGDTVKVGQIIAVDEQYFHMGDLAIYGAGYNAYTLQAPYRVWNYEDALVVSESFAKNVAKSTHIQKIAVEIQPVYRITKINLEERPDLIGSGQIQVKKSEPLVIMRPQNLSAFELKIWNREVNASRTSRAGNNDEIGDLEQLLESLAEETDIPRRTKHQKRKHLNEFLSIEETEEGDILDTFEQSPEHSETASITETSGDTDELASEIDDTVGEDESMIESDFSGKTVYPPFNGVIAQIEVYAKDEETLRKYEPLYKFWQSKKAEVQKFIKQLKSKGVDTSPLEQHWVFNNFGKTYKGQPIENVLVIYHIYGEKETTIGDKFHNRHGNKGTIALILPDDKMPRDPEGKPFEVIMNPTGVISRKNIGQLIEMFTTRLTVHIHEKILKPLYEQRQYNKMLNQLKQFYQKFYMLDPKHEFAQVGKKVLAELEKLEQNKTAKQKFLDLIYKYGIPVMLPPITRTNYRNIMALMREYGLKPRDYYYDPVLGTKPKRPAAFGYVYWFKTVHIVDKKMHARSIGRYSRTMQATAGRAKEGGMRLGELEVFGLIAWNAGGVLTEFMTLGSDDLQAKMTIYNTIIQNGEASLLQLRENPTSRTAQKLRVLLECLQILEPQN